MVTFHLCSKAVDMKTELAKLFNHPLMQQFTDVYIYCHQAPQLDVYAQLLVSLKGAKYCTHRIGEKCAYLFKGFVFRF